MEYITTDDRIIIRRDPEEEKRVGSLIIAQIVEEPRNKGTVVETGPGRKTKKGVVIAPAVKPGDRVMFTEGAGIDVRVNGEDLMIIKEEDIIGFIDE